jgi:hypothetical protein
MRQLPNNAYSGRMASKPRVGRANDQFAVSNISMAKPNQWIVKASVFLFLLSLVSAQGARAQARVDSATTPELFSCYSLEAALLAGRDRCNRASTL